MKLAVLVRDLGPSQLAHQLIIRANTLLKGRADLDLVVYQERLVRPCHTCNFAVTHVADGWAYDGPALATSLSTAAKLATFPSVTRKFFYVWDLEWTRTDRREYRQFLPIYRDHQFTLLSRCADHARVISNAWNRSVTVVPDFDVAAFFELSK